MSAVIKWLKEQNHRRLFYMRKMRKSLYSKVFIWLNHPKKSHTPDFSKPLNIGIMMLNKGIGDTIVASGLISELKNRSHNVSIICNEKLHRSIKDIYADLCGFIVIRKKQSLLSLLMNRIHVDLIIDLYDDDVKDYAYERSLNKFKNPYVVGFNSHMCAGCYNQLFERNICEHFSKRSEFVLKELFNISVPEYSYHMNVSPAADSSVNEFLKTLPAGKLVVVNSQASCPYRSLSEQMINNIISYFSGAYCRDDAEKRLCSVVLLNFKKEDITVPAENVHIPALKSFEEVVSLIKKADFLISPDTSIVHVGCAFHKKAVYMYNNRIDHDQEVNTVWGPVGSDSIVVTTSEYLHSNNGDDLRKLDFNPVKDALEKSGFTKDE